MADVAPVTLSLPKSWYEACHPEPRRRVLLCAVYGYVVLQRAQDDNLGYRFVLRRAPHSSLLRNSVGVGRMTFGLPVAEALEATGT
jgi:hypothetical protein